MLSGMLSETCILTTVKNLVWKTPNSSVVRRSLALSSQDLVALYVTIPHHSEGVRRNDSHSREQNFHEILYDIFYL